MNNKIDRYKFRFLGKDVCDFEKAENLFKELHSPILV